MSGVVELGLLRTFGQGLAEYLAAQGAAVTYVTRHAAFGSQMDNAFMAEPALQRLSRADFRYLTRMRVIAIDDEGVLVGPSYLPKDSGRSEKVPADVVVFVSINHPNRGLYNELLDLGLAVQIVGDANSPRYLGQAIKDGYSGRSPPGTRRRTMKNRNALYKYTELRFGDTAELTESGA